MTLGERLKNPYFTKDREELFNYQLFYEIKKTGLEQGVDFELLEPIIDKNGYDLLIKHGNQVKPLQLKCTEKNATKSWEINKRFFRPSNLQDADLIIEDSSATFIGSGGGVLIMEYAVDEVGKIELKYFYSDFAVLSIFQRSVRKWQMKTGYVDYVANIFDDQRPKFSLPKSLFIQVSVLQFLYLSRNLPTTPHLRNPGHWTFHYKSGELGLLHLIPKQERMIFLRKPNDTRFHEFKLKIRDIFDCGLEEISVNGVLTL